MDITTLKPEDTAAVDETWALHLVCRAHDDPDDEQPLSRRLFQCGVENVHPNEHQTWLIARVDGSVVGAAMCTASTIDNPHLMGSRFLVHPAHRRRGVGTALLEETVRLGRAAGHRTQTVTAAEALPGGDRRTHDGRDFLLHHGFSIGHVMRSRQVDLRVLDGAIEQEILDESWPHAGDYELVQWRGATPAEHVAGAAKLWGRLYSDVPFGDIEVTVAAMDTERYLLNESVEMRRGADFACSYVRHKESDELVAHSVIAVHEDSPQYGGQWITLVHPDHRGHRLGMIVKIENHRQLRREFPDVRWIETANAESNRHMIAINERLGFAERSRFLEFQREL